MKVHDLVIPYNDPLEGPVDIAEGVLGVVVEIQGMTAKVLFPGKILLTYRLMDLSTIDF